MCPCALVPPRASEPHVSVRLKPCLSARAPGAHLGRASRVPSGAILVSSVFCSGHIRNAQIAMPTPGSKAQMPVPGRKIIAWVKELVKLQRFEWMKRLKICHGQRWNGAKELSKAVGYT